MKNNDFVLPFRGYGTLTPVKYKLKRKIIWGYRPWYFSTTSAVFCIKITKNVRKKDIVKVWYIFEKYGFDLWPKLSHNVTTLDNTDIDISMSHVLLFPKIYNLAVCHTIKANRQKSIPCYPTINISCQHESHIQDLDLERHMFGLFFLFSMNCWGERWLFALLILVEL